MREEGYANQSDRLELVPLMEKTKVSMGDTRLRLVDDSMVGTRLVKRLRFEDQVRRLEVQGVSSRADFDFWLAQIAMCAQKFDIKVEHIPLATLPQNRLRNVHLPQDIKETWDKVLVEYMQRVHE